MRGTARHAEARDEAESLASAWRGYDPDGDSAPPAPGLPPVSHRPHPASDRPRRPAAMAAALLALSYVLLTLAWTLLR